MSFTPSLRSPDFLILWSLIRGTPAPPTGGKKTGGRCDVVKPTAQGFNCTQTAAPGRSTARQLDGSTDLIFRKNG